MSEEKTGEQIRADYVAKMGHELGELFHALSSDLTWVHWRWMQFRILFVDKSSRIDLLNKCAPFFFYIIHRALFEDTLLGIARLAGPRRSTGKPNLTVQRLPGLVKDDLREDVCEHVEEARKASEFVFDWRNRRIAHRDLNLALQRGARPLKPATSENVEHALSALRDVMNGVEMAYCGAHTAYDFSSTPGDAETLLYVLTDGLQLRREKHERWKRGEVAAGDSESGDEI